MSFFNELDRLTAQGFLRKVQHEDLVLYNYTDKCTYEKHWNNWTLNSRGTVYEKHTGKVVAQAFPKFFNFGELSKEEQEKLNNRTDIKIYEKIDGSLGIVYFWNGKWRVNTRGSFTSDQAVYATEVLLPKYNMSELSKDITLLVEIVYPENRIIVDYGSQEKLVLLSAYCVGTEVYPWSREYIAKTVGMSQPKVYTFNTLDDVIAAQSTLPASDEGYVVEFGHGYRVKFKSIEYMKVARIMSNASLLGIWENFSRTNRGHIDLAFLESLPEEFREDINKNVQTLEKQYTEVAIGIAHDNLDVHGMSKKEIGIGIKEGTLKLNHPSVVFSFMDSKLDNVDEYIRKTIRPTGNVLRGA